MSSDRQHDEIMDDSTIKKSGSTSKLIQQFENGLAPTNSNSKLIKEPVLITTDEVPINMDLALAKEDLILNYYFGLPTVSAGDFINSELDSFLLTQLELEPNIVKCQNHVAAYLSNYTNWASLARMHSHKTQLKV